MRYILFNSVANVLLSTAGADGALVTASLLIVAVFYYCYLLLLIESERANFFWVKSDCILKLYFTRFLYANIGGKILFISE